jgi:hypothetical protein
MRTTSGPRRAFQITVFSMLGALVLEFILGMYTALFVTFPEGLANGNAWEWSMTQSPVIMAHVALATILALLSLVATGLAIASRNRWAIGASLAGLAMILFAYLSGSIFLTNVEQDSYSFTMSIGFILAMVAYGMANVTLRDSEKQTGSPR